MGNSSSARFAELTGEYRQQHFLIGIVLSELASVIELQYVLNRNQRTGNVMTFNWHFLVFLTFFRSPALHARAVNLLRNLLTSHDWDPRYSDASCKARVAALYLPLIGVLLDGLPRLYDWSSEGKCEFLPFPFCKQ